MTVDTTIQFLMDTLKGDSVLAAMVNNKMIAELPRSDMVLDGSYKTIIGMTILGSSQQSYFRSQIRGYVQSNVSAQVSVLSGNGSNDQYCRTVVKQIRDTLQDGSYIGTYRIFIDSIKDDIKVDGSPGKWVGNIMIEMTRFDEV
jgi:hypothetical protein